MIIKKIFQMASEKVITELVDGGVKQRQPKEKIMTTQVFTNDELINLIQERWAKQSTSNTEFANQLAKNVIKKLHNQKSNIRNSKATKRSRCLVQVNDEKSGHFKKLEVKKENNSNSEFIDGFDANNTPPPVIGNAIKRIHDQDVKLRYSKGKNRNGLFTQVNDEKSGHFMKLQVKKENISNSEFIDGFDANNTPPPVIRKQIKKHDKPNMTCKEMAMTIINCKEILENKIPLDKNVANKFTSVLKSRLAYKLKTKPNTSSK